MTQKSTPKDALRGQWLYDFLMKGIEEDLLSENLPTLGGKYRNESNIDHAARMERYDKAFAEFDRVIGLIADQLTSEAMEYRHTARERLEAEEKQEHEEDVNKAEHLFDDEQ
jgi:hypothetical protein